VKREYITIVHPILTGPPEMVRVLCQSRHGTKECLVAYRDGKDPHRSFKGICMMENGVIQGRAVFMNGKRKRFVFKNMVDGRSPTPSEPVVTPPLI
jgi:hypothetical protein